VVKFKPSPPETGKGEAEGQGRATIKKNKKDTGVPQKVGQDSDEWCPGGGNTREKGRICVTRKGEGVGGGGGGGAGASGGN